jgi:hypothetical protein
MRIRITLLRIRITLVSLMRIRIPLLILMRIRDQLNTLTLIRIWFLLRIMMKVMQICDHCLQTLHGSILSLYASVVIVHGPP